MRIGFLYIQVVGITVSVLSLAALFYIDYREISTSPRHPLKSTGEIYLKYAGSSEPLWSRGPPSVWLTPRRRWAAVTFLSGAFVQGRGLSLRPASTSCPLCLRMVFREKFDETRCVMDGRKYASSCSLGSKSSANAIRRRGHAGIQAAVRAYGHGSSNRHSS
jgi:hypothetical protein